MKKSVIIMVLILLCLSCAVMLVACSEEKKPSRKDDPDTEQGPEGGEGNSHEHVLKHHVAVKSTCAIAGNQEYWECTGCGKCFSDEDAGVEIEDAKAVMLPLAEHMYDVNNICTKCEQPLQYTTGLEYSQTQDGSGYILTGKGTAVLADVVIPPYYNGKPVVEIGIGALNHSTSMASVSIPVNVVNIASGAFQDCRNLITVSFDKNSQVRDIGAWAFANCTSLSQINLEANSLLENIRESAFNGDTALITITIPDNVWTIDSSAFYDCNSLVAVNIGDKCRLNTIGSEAFYACHSLSFIELPHLITKIGDFAFAHCRSLMTITIPANVGIYGEDVFYKCNKLIEVYNLSSKNIEVGGEEEYDEIGYCATEIYTSTAEKSKLFTDDDGFVFYDDGVDRHLIGYTGTQTNVVLPESYNGQPYVLYPYALAYRKSLKSVTVPASVEDIGPYAFSYCSELKEVVILEGVTTIGQSAFSNCNALVTITIPTSVMTVETSAFYKCKNLATVTFQDDSKLTSIWDTAFYGCEGLTTINFGENSRLKSIGANVFYNCASLTSIALPDSLTDLGDSAFFFCSKLRTVTFGTDSQLERIGSSVFSYCPSLTSFTIPASVRSIGKYVFGSTVTSVYFKNTEGWQLLTSANSTAGTAISATELSSASDAAMYLTETYSYCYWKRS